ncbi:MAG: hypothetical protein ABIP19_05330, partial [Dermatophilaceae bacterium]
MSPLSNSGERPAPRMPRPSPPSRTGRAFGALASVLAVTLTFSGCALTSAQDEARTPSPEQKSAAQVPPTGEEALAT